MDRDLFQDEREMAVVGSLLLLVLAAGNVVPILAAHELITSVAHKN